MNFVNKKEMFDLISFSADVFHKVWSFEYEDTICAFHAYSASALHLLWVVNLCIDSVDAHPRESFYWDQLLYELLDNSCVSHDSEA